MTSKSDRCQSIDVVILYKKIDTSLINAVNDLESPIIRETSVETNLPLAWTAGRVQNAYHIERFRDRLSRAGERPQRTLPEIQAAGSSTELV